jgi:hypothetical protein
MFILLLIVIPETAPCAGYRNIEYTAAKVSVAPGKLPIFPCKRRAITAVSVLLDEKWSLASLAMSGNVFLSDRLPGGGKPPHPDIAACFSG